jgi:hypothetical protein
VVALVGPECGEARHRQPLAAVGAQPQVDIVQAAGGRRAGQPSVEPLRQPRVALRRRLGVVVVEIDKIEIRRVAKLAPAELAVADDREARGGVSAPTICAQQQASVAARTISASAERWSQA